MDAVTADFSEELRPQVPQIAQALPQPVTKAEVLSVDIGDPVSVAMIRYSGSSSGVTIRSDWLAAKPKVQEALAVAGGLILLGLGISFVAGDGWTWFTALFLAAAGNAAGLLWSYRRHFARRSMRPS